jgi:cell division protease FtsH
MRTFSVGTDRPGSLDRSPVPDGSGGGQPASPGPAGRRSLVPTWVSWLVLVGAVAWNLVAFFEGQGTPTASIPYSTFLAQVRAGNVAGVTISGQEIDGGFKQSVDDATLGIDDSSGASNATPTASPLPTTVTYAQFTTVMPAMGDDSLLPLLENQGVTITAKDASAGSWLVDLMVSVLPTVFLVGVILFMARQARRGQQTMLGFGTSRARRYASTPQQVTFADVAGEDEAKLEL